MPVPCRYCSDKPALTRHCEHCDLRYCAKCGVTYDLMRGTDSMDDNKMEKLKAREEKGR